MGGYYQNLVTDALALRRKSILYYGKSEPNYPTERCFNLAVILGTILIGFN
jgi:hypothetical protein